MSTPNLKSEALPIEPASQSTTLESLGWQLRAALPPLRLHSVSVYDVEGEVLWLSEGALGPDEHGFVSEALEEFRDDRSGTHRESDFHDGRGAVILAVRGPRAALIGLVMIVVDSKALTTGTLAARVMTRQVQAILQRLAGFLYPRWEAAAADTTRAKSAAPASSEASSPGQADTSSTVNVELPELLAPKDIDDILTFELTDEFLLTIPGLGDDAEAHTAEPEAAAVQRERAVVQPESAAVQHEQAAEALIARLEEVIAWLRANAQLAERVPLNFSLAVSASAIEAADLPDLVARCLRNAFVRADKIGFQIEESVHASHRAQTERFCRTVEQLGSFLVIDNFTFDSAALELLRCKALCLVKVDPAPVPLASLASQLADPK